MERSFMNEQMHKCHAGLLFQRDFFSKKNSEKIVS